MSESMVDQMLEQLRVRGLTVRADGDRLLVGGDTKELTPEVRAAIAKFKPHLLARLRDPAARRFDVHHPPPPEEGRPIPPSAMAAGDPAPP